MPPDVASLFADLGLTPPAGPRRRAFRANLLRQPVEALGKELTAAGIPFAPHPLSPWSFTTDAAGEYALKGSAPFREGRLYCQSIPSQLPALLPELRPADRIIDACAAPGGKTSLLAMRAPAGCRITALERARVRFQKLTHTLRLQGAEALVEARCCDARFPPAALLRQPPRVILLDPPCTGSGLLRADDPRSWERLARDYEGFVALQSRIQAQLLATWAAVLPPDGELVYSTCSIDPRENEQVVTDCLRAHPDLDLVDLASWRGRLADARPGLPGFRTTTYDPRLDRCLRLNPCPEGEGFFVAHLVARSAVGGR